MSTAVIVSILGMMLVVAVSAYCSLRATGRISMRREGYCTCTRSGAAGDQVFQENARVHEMVKSCQYPKEYIGVL